MNKINFMADIARRKGITESDNLRDNIVEEYTDIIESLDTIDESVIVKDIGLLPVYKVEEGYAIDLDSLKYVVESEQITLEEAIQEIRDVNYIGDTIPMYCVLPNDINEISHIEGSVEQLIQQSVADACAEVQQNNLQMTNTKAEQITDSIYKKTYEILEGQGE